MPFFSKFKELDILGVQFNTNKSSSWVGLDNQRVKNITLLDKYELFLQYFKDVENFKMLELGAGPDPNIGASCRMWKQYFHSTSEIHVADIKPSALKLGSEGMEVHVGDLGNIGFLTRLAEKKWDFIIDDGSHFWLHQILAFRNLFNSLESGGIFICEDLCTSFGKMRDFYSMGMDQKDPVEYFLAISRRCCGIEQSNDRISSIYNLTELDLRLADQVKMISWMGNSCIIVKK